MNTATFKRPRPSLRPAVCTLRLRGAAALAACLLATTHLPAMPVVDTLTGGPWQGNPLHYGYVDGDTAGAAQFNTPFALALGNADHDLYVADRANNAVRRLDLAGNQTYTFTTQWLKQPVGVAVDRSNNVYVLNYANGTNGYVLKFDIYGDFVATNAVGLTNPTGMSLDGAGNIYIAVRTNTVVKVTPAGVKTTVATVTNTGAVLRGIVAKHNGLLAACDSGRHGIYLINPLTGTVSTNAGFHGAGDFTNANNVASAEKAMFNQPHGLVEAGDGTLVVADFGNHRVKVVLATGVVTNLYGVSSNKWVGPASPSLGIYPGWYDGTVAVPDDKGGVEARQPVGLAFASDGTIYASEIYYHLIRKVTSTGLPPPPPPPPPAPTIWTVTTNIGQVSLSWSTATGATNYFVKRTTSSGGPYTTIATTTATSHTDTDVINGRTYYYVVSASGPGGEGPNSAEVVATVPLPPVADPKIGYIDFPAWAYTSVFHPISSFVFNNDAPIVIVGEAGSQTYYTFGSTTAEEGVPDPTSSSFSAPAGYQDGLSEGQARLYAIVQPMPDMTIKAIGMKNDGSPNSAIVESRFQFVTANPVINGDNAAHFTISDITSNARLFYTLDGSDPSSTNVSAVDLGTVATPTNVWNVSFPIQTNTLFKIRAFRANFQPSAIVSKLFTTNDFSANRITFGFQGGEASSDFVASAGQTFYAPVTLTLLDGAEMYSLQFSLSVTNAGPNPGPAVTPGAVNFMSTLVKPLPNSPGTYIKIPPAMFLTHAAIPPDPPPGSVVFPYNDGWFQDLRFVNTANNLLGVGWLERKWGMGTNLYDTTTQDLITYSMAHDTIFQSINAKVVLGGYSFQVPTDAQAGHSYQIRIERPTATSDGVGAPGALVYLDAPTSGSLSNGAINALKWVTVGQKKYLAGDAYDFRWFNAGDFGNGALENADVMQVFQSAIYGLNRPLPNSDFEDAMDSAGRTVATAPAWGEIVLETSALPHLTPDDLFDGNDTDINRIVFGDGQLDVTDVYVTFRRSLDSSLNWYQRFWTNGVRGVLRATNQLPGASQSPLPAASPRPEMGGQSASGESPAVQFMAGDAIASAGQTIQVPIIARVRGDYPLRMLMLNLTVQPLDGSPVLEQTIQFTQLAALGTPWTVSSAGPQNYSAVWINRNATGLAGSNIIGMLTLKLPAGASASAAYAIRFDHASGSPNGLASFPKSLRTGLVALSDRSGSSWGDGISDAWRLRYFGTLNNVLSAAPADADGDGHPNGAECRTGTAPNDAESVLKLLSQQGGDFTVRWPSVAGKRYVIERASTMFGTDWSPVSTNTGTGWDMEFTDPDLTSSPRFYRVRVAE